MMRRKIKGIMRSFFIVLLLACVFLGTCPSGYGISATMAVESIGETAEEQENDPEPEPQPDPEPEPEKKISLLASTSNMVINIKEGEDFRQAFSVKNTGNATANLGWSFSGIDGVGLEINGQTLSAGCDAVCYVKNTSLLERGTYSGSAYVGVLNVGSTDDSDSMVRVAVTINVDAKDNPAPEPEPTPTPKPTPPGGDDKTYAVNVGAEPSSGGQVSGGGFVKAGGYVDVVAVANNGYTFKGWAVDDKIVSKSNRYTVGVTDRDVTAIAKFEQNKVYVTLKASPSDYGKVSESGYVKPGGNFEIKASPKSGYHFVAWKEDGETISTDRKYTLKNVTEDRKIKAVFEPDTYKVKIVVSPEGTGTYGGDGSFTAGKDVTVKANPDKGYKFAGWAINGQVVSTDRSYTLKKIDADYTLVAMMQKEGGVSYEIKAAVSGDGGKITPSGTTKVGEGANMRYSFTPDPGYRVKDILVDKTYFPAGEFFTFTKVTGPHNITVTFEKIPQKQAAKTEEKATLKQAADTASKPGATDAAAPQKAPGDTDEEHEQAVAEDIAKYWGGEDETNDGEDLWSEEEVAQVSGILEEYNLSPEQAREIIRDGRSGPLFTAAYIEGYIGVAVNNSYGASSQETGDGTIRTDSSIPNLMDVVQNVVTEDEAIAVLSGKKLSLNLSIANYDKAISEYDRQQVEEAAKNSKYKVGEYMDILFVKSIDGDVSTINELDSPMEIKIKIPQKLKGRSKGMAVVRLHYNADGSCERTLLQDTDDDPDTVTIKTDKFSVYALAYPASGIDINMIILIAAIAFAVAVTIVLIVVIRKTRRG